MKEKNIQELAVRMQLVTVEDMCQYTVSQLVVKIANKVNELVNEVWRFETDVQEILKTQNENIQYLLGEGLHLEVENIFDGWVQDGTFDTLLNQSALKKVNDRIDETNAQLSVTKTFLSVDEYGAKNDGITDNTAFFEKALKDAYLYNVPLKLSKGVYKGNFNFQLDESITGDDGNTPEGLINVKVKISGVGEETILKPITGSAIKIKGNSTQSARSISIENLTIDGDDKNVTGIELEKTQNINIDNVFIWNCKKNGILLNGAMDLKINNLNIIGCGGVSDKTYYSVEMKPLVGHQSTNAVHIDKLRIELSPYLISIIGSDQIYIDNYKFEKATENNTNNRPIFIDGSSSITFGFGVNTNNTYNGSLLDSGKTFIDIGSNQNSIIKFIGCDFITPDGQTCNWYQGGYTLFESCVFKGCDGGNSGYSFTLNRGKVSFKNCHIDFENNSKLFLINSSNVDIDIKLNNKNNKWDYPIFSLTDADFVDIKYDYYNIYPTTSYKAVYLADYYKISDGFYNAPNSKFKRNINNQFEGSGFVITENPYEIVKMTSGNFAGCRNTYDGYELTLVSLGNVVVVTSQNVKTKSGENVTLTNNQIMRFICVNGQLYEV